MTKKNAPCEAVMLLLKRMQSHPEEFRLDAGKWGHFLTVVKRRVVDKSVDTLIILEDFEAEMLWNGFKTAGKKQLLSFVMEKILEGEDGK